MHNRSFVRPLRRAVCAVALVGLSVLRASVAHSAEQRVTLTNSVGSMHASVAATRRVLTASDLAGSLSFSFALKMRNFDELQARVARGETFSRAELEQHYLPLASDYDAVKAWAIAQGLALQPEDDSRLGVYVRGTVAQVESCLQVNMVKVTFEGVDFPAADSEPSLPENLAKTLVGVNGLHPYHQLKRHSRKLPPKALTNGLQPEAVPANGYSISNILTAFDALNLGVTGAGQTIAILIDATPLASDLSGFYSYNGLPASTVNNVTTINVNNGTITKREGEETLDVEWTSGIAPGAKIRVYATATLDDTALDAGLARILSDAKTDATIHQLSISLGLGEVYGSSSQFLTDAQYFAALASQGISTFVSSGDGGSTPDYSGASAGPLQVEYYASDPSVTAVGGTALNTDSSFRRTSETVWGPYTTTNGATGGGTSIQFTRPSWQTGAGVPAAATGNAAMRLVPDVALPADPYTGAYTYYNGAASPIGGTSWSAPTWAGFCALINHARANAGKTGGIGLLNPSVYPLIGTSNFYDITLGNNNVTSSRSGGKYPANAGYDQCTGVGTPDVKVILNTLVSGTVAVSAPTVSGFSPTGGAANTIVSIAGTDFTNAVRVGFNGHQAAFAVISPTQILATVPTDAATGAITVVTTGGTVTSAGSFTFSATSGAPTISDIAPYQTTNTISTTQVVVTGTNLSTVTTATFNGVSATVSNKTSTTVRLTIPSTSTKGPVTVTNSSGTAISATTFTTVSSSGTVGSAGPTITSFTPTSGATGTSVTLNGTNLLGETAVLFNGLPATTFTVTSLTTITVPVPAGATTGNITVVGRGGTVTSASAFTVGGTVSAPTITSLTPASGPVGTSVAITGTNLTGATAVSFNGTAATSYSVDSATQVTATVPTGATTGTVSVTTAGGTATSSTAYTVTTANATPTVTGFTPTSGPVGTSVAITGTNLTGATSVKFGGTASTSVTVNSATQITATVPTGAASGTIGVTTPNGTGTSSGAFTVTTSGGGGTVTHVVISQVYGGGGGSTGTYANDYIELFNPTSAAVDLGAYSVQYASATGSSYQKTNLTGTLQPQHYYLVAESTGTAGATLPTADATGAIAMSATAGKVALVSNQTVLGTTTTSTSAGVVDYVGYGTTANVYEGTSFAPAPSASTADFRANGGYTDTDNNAADFTVAAPNPRNSSVTNAGGTPDLTVTMTHAAAFKQADTGDTYTLVVSNGGTAATSDAVTVTVTLPSGLTLTGLSGTGWTSGGSGTATRSDVLAAGASYPAITATVNVSASAPSSVTSSATVSGGGETNSSNNAASDVTAITALTPSQNWRYTYFGTTADAGDAADVANPSGDGLSNLLKYALGLDPRTPAALQVTVDVSTGYLRLTTPRNADATDVTLGVQVSSAPGNGAAWATSGTTINSTPSNILQAHDNTPVSSAAPRFLRLIVTRP